MKDTPEQEAQRPRAESFWESLRCRLERAFAVSPGRLSAALVVTMALDFVLLTDPAWQLPLTVLQGFLFVVCLGSALRRDLTPEPYRQVRRYLFPGLLAACASIALAEKTWIALQAGGALRLAYAESYRIEGATISLCAIGLVLGRGQRFLRFFAAFAEHPARQMALSFAGLAAFGGFLLTLPLCVRDPSHVSFVNALFMATSAVSVTGLAVHDIATTYTALGQGVLLALVQIGGLGIMVLSASLSVLAGRKLRAKNSSMLAELLDADSVSSLRGSITRIVLFTLVIEAVGAALLFAVFSRYPEIALPESVAHPMAGSGSLLWAAVFHSITAFCNAGFTLMHGGISSFSAAPGVCGILMLLVILGGLGFPVLSELTTYGLRRLRREHPSRLSLHTRVALRVSLILFLGVAALLLLLEWNHSLAHLSWPERGLAALFHSVSLRSAGFSSVDFAHFTPVALALAAIVIFIGACPGGTGGGIKVTTFAVLLASFRAELKGETEAVLLDRRLPESTIQRAIAVVFVSAILLSAIVLILLFTEQKPPLELVFEAVSAFGTAGLSTGITTSLSPMGKLTVALTMLIGRIGPLTLALAATERGTRRRVHSAQERVLIG